MVPAISILFAKVPALFAAVTCSDRMFFGLPVWWKYLKPQPQPPNCEITKFDVPDDIWLVVLAGVEMLLWVAGMAAVVMVIFGGYKYMSAVGNTEKTVSARRTIINALIGLAITVIATAFVSFIGKSLG